MRFRSPPKSEFTLTEQGGEKLQDVESWTPRSLCGTRGVSLEKELCILPQMTAALLRANAGTLTWWGSNECSRRAMTEAPPERKLAHTVFMKHLIYTLVAQTWHPKEGKDWLPNLRLYTKEVME